MALSPLNRNTGRVVESKVTVSPSKTYRLDKTTLEIGGVIDGTDALRQFILKAVGTARNRFMIYDSEYGCELSDYIGANVSNEFLNVEITRVIREALIYDDRISDVTNFNITQDDDKLYVSFDVISNNGIIIMEGVTISGV